MRRSPYILIPLLVALGAEVAATPVLELSDASGRVMPGSRLEFLADPGRELSLAGILDAPERYPFEQARDDRPNFGFVPAAYWARVRVVNRMSDRERFLIQLNYPPMDDFRIYLPDGIKPDSESPVRPAGTGPTSFSAPGYTMRQGGDLLPFDRRDVKHRTFLFPVRIPEGVTHTIYFRFQTAGAVVMAIEFLTPETLRTADHEEQMAFGLYYGILGVLSLYNAVLFFLVRDRSYLYYFFYITGFGMVQLNLNGLAYEYLWPGLPWWNNVALPFAIGWTFFWGLMFSRQFLNSRQQTPWMDALLRYQLPGMVGLMISALVLPYRLNINLSSILIIIFSFTVFGTAIASVRSGYRPARYFLLAWTVFLVASTIYALKGMGVLPSNFFTEYGMQIGSGLEMALLSLGLADRIALINAEKEAARRQTMEIERLRGMAELRGARLEIELLKKHLQPHFLLNSINSSIAYLEEDPPTGVRLLQALSTELRHLLKVIDRPLIPVSEEVAICRAHLKHMSLRHEKKFQLRVAGAPGEVELPPLILHTLIENGLTHGFAGREGGRFELDVESAAEDQMLRIRLANNGDNVTGKNSQGTGTGLKYVRSRLEETFPGRWQLRQGPTADGWEAVIEIMESSSAPA